MALCLSTGVSFAIAGIAKAFNLDAMVAFFAQSGYSKEFLHVIMAFEVFAGMALLLPWRGIVIAAVAGLAIDMVGAITTHVHNGDPLDDSAGAISALLRLALLAVLSVPRAWAAAGAGLVTAAGIAGSMVVRHPEPVPPPAPPPASTASTR